MHTHGDIAHDLGWPLNTQNHHIFDILQHLSYLGNSLTGEVKDFKFGGQVYHRIFQTSVFAWLTIPERGVIRVTWRLKIFEKVLMSQTIHTRMLIIQWQTNSRSNMAYQMAPTAVTLNGLEGHSQVTGLFKCNSSTHLRIILQGFNWQHARAIPPR